MSTLCRLVAPLALRVRFTAGEQPFELSWDDEKGARRVTGATMRDAVLEASHLLFDHDRPSDPPVTEPEGETGFAEAMRELIERTRAFARPRLRLVR